MNPPAYRATVERDGRFWLVRVPGVGVTQARHLREVDAMARDLVAVVTDVEPDVVELMWHVVLPEAVQAHLERASRLRNDAAAAQFQAAVEVRAAARALADTGLTLRDIGQALGVSYQRAHQLVRGPVPSEPGYQRRGGTATVVRSRATTTSGNTVRASARNAASSP